MVAQAIIDVGDVRHCLSVIASDEAVDISLMLLTSTGGPVRSRGYASVEARAACQFLISDTFHAESNAY